MTPLILAAPVITAVLFYCRRARHKVRPGKNLPTMIRHILTVPLSVATVAGAQAPPSRVLPSQALIPGAPTTDCSFPSIHASTPTRITTGKGPIPYQFACGVNRPLGVCAVNTLPPGLVVSLGAEQNGWACVTGGDSTSGWIPVQNLAQVPSTPHVPLAEWIGWWRQDNEVKGKKNNRLLIVRQRGSNLLHISGRAYWYGLSGNVHFGEVQADATPVGVYLHAVDTGCVVDLKLDLATHTLKTYDNMRCGGMNVRFNGTWKRFTPKQHSE